MIQKFQKLAYFLFAGKSEAPYLCSIKSIKGHYSMYYYQRYQHTLSSTVYHIAL